MILFDYNEMRELNAYLLRTYLILDGLINLFGVMTSFDKFSTTTINNIYFVLMSGFVRFSCLVLSGSDVNNYQHSADRVSSKI